MGSQYDMPWAVFKLQNNTFAVTVENIQGIIRLDKVHPVPGAPQYVRGIMNVRGKVIPLVDLRTLFNMGTFKNEHEEFCSVLVEREEDHKHWLDELYLSVQENRPFTLAKDPHKCKFGMWYDKFKSPSEDIMNLHSQFDDPHRRIHAIAQKVESLKERGEKDKAVALINKTRKNELMEMVRLFEDAKRLCMISQRESAIIIENENARLAISVDEVIAVENIEEEKVENADSSSHNLFNKSTIVSGIGRRSSDDSFIMLLSQDELLKTNLEAVELDS